MKKTKVLTAFLALTFLSMPVFAQQSDIDNNQDDVNVPLPSDPLSDHKIDNLLLSGKKIDGFTQTNNEVVFIKNEAFLNTYMRNHADKPTVVFFYDESCDLSKKEMTMLKNIAHIKDEVNIVAINYKNAPNMMTKFGIDSTPYFVTIKGDKYAKYSGYREGMDLLFSISESTAKVNNRGLWQDYGKQF
jgi:thiol-disulfide isomerase/thioredoxin